MAFERRKGILLVDTIVLGFPLYLQEGLPQFLHPHLWCPTSGVLWHACFGHLGERTFDVVENHFHPNVHAPLQLNGALIDSESLEAVIYTVHADGERKFVGFFKEKEADEGLMEAIAEICQFINDDRNSRYHLLSPYPFGWPPQPPATQ
ncbi:MAG TPA: hypothetical protein VEY06_14870 [Flavisolibacter sp.]|nr:hypothetical protein [Flavisolibacter sp.]